MCSLILPLVGEETEDIKVEVPISYLRNALIYYELYNIEVDLNESYKKEIDVLTDQVSEWEIKHAEVKSRKDTYFKIAVIVGGIMLARTAIDVAVQLR